MSATLNRLAKWRTIFVSWQLGTRTSTDPEAQAVRDHREVTMLLRVEVNALVQLLVAKGVITADEFARHCDVEAEHLMRAYERFFPGAVATDDGMKIDLAQAQAWMGKFPK
jgi:hypothetical protein